MAQRQSANGAEVPAKRARLGRPARNDLTSYPILTLAGVLLYSFLPAPFASKAITHTPPCTTASTLQQVYDPNRHRRQCTTCKRYDPSRSRKGGRKRIRHGHDSQVTSGTRSAPCSPNQRGQLRSYATPPNMAQSPGVATRISKRLDRRAAARHVCSKAMREVAAPRIPRILVRY